MSKVSQNLYEVNGRILYSIRSIGCGWAGAKQFCGLMNMPSPPQACPYSAHNKALLSAKAVCRKTMQHAAIMLCWVMELCKEDFPL